MGLVLRGKALCTCVIIGIYGPVYFGSGRISGIVRLSTTQQKEVGERWRMERGEKREEGRTTC